MVNVTVAIENYHVFGMIIGTTAIFGLITNITSMWILYFGGKISCSFQQLCFSHCFSNFMDEMLFLFYCCPSAFFKMERFTQDSIIARLLGGWMVFQWNISVYSHLMVSINRLIVLTWPVQSRAFLTQKVSTIMIAIVWIFSAMNFVPYLLVNTCYIRFNVDLFFFLYSDNFCGFLLDKVEYLGGTISVITIFSFDIWTMTRLIKYKMSRGSTVLVQDVRFFLQAVLQGIVFINALTNFFLVTPHFAAEKNFLVVFFLNTFIWQFTQGMDGLILIPFHIGDYRRRKEELSKAPISQTAVSQGPGPTSNGGAVSQSQSLVSSAQQPARSTASIAPTIPATTNGAATNGAAAANGTNGTAAALPPIRGAPPVVPPLNLPGTNQVIPAAILDLSDLGSSLQTTTKV